MAVSAQVVRTGAVVCLVWRALRPIPIEIEVAWAELSWAACCEWFDWFGLWLSQH